MTRVAALGPEQMRIRGSGHASGPGRVHSTDDLERVGNDELHAELESLRYELAGADPFGLDAAAMVCASACRTRLFPARADYRALVRFMHLLAESRAVVVSYRIASDVRGDVRVTEVCRVHGGRALQTDPI